MYTFCFIAALWSRSATLKKSWFVNIIRGLQELAFMMFRLSGNWRKSSKNHLNPINPLCPYYDHRKTFCERITRISIHDVSIIRLLEKVLKEPLEP